MKPIESKEFPGFYEIPGYSKYCINRKSDIKHKRKNKIINQYDVKGSFSSDINTGCYKRATMTNDNNCLSAVLVHRLMAIVFCHPGVGFDITTLQVNHKDHNKCNNVPENLEWITCEDNIKHSKQHYKSRKHIPIQIRYIDSNLVVDFGNVTAAAKSLKLHRTTLLSRLHGAVPGHVFPEGVMIRYKPSDPKTPWPKKGNVTEEIETYYTKPLLIKNVLTEEIFEFPSGIEAVKLIGLSPATISEYSNDETQPVFWGKNGEVYIAKKKYPESPFRTIYDPYLDMIERDNLRRIVMAVNVENGKRRIYETTQKCATDFNLNKTTLNWRLKREVPSSFNGWIFRYYEEALSLRNE